MRRFFHKERNINYLIFSIVGLCGLAWFINSIPPEIVIMQGVFYIILGIITFCIGMFVFASKKEALLLSVGSIVYFLLRSLNLRHPLYLILLILLCLSILSSTKTHPSK